MARAYTTDDERWNALVNRDRQADGVFLYAVRTTGVYCRPICASRLPNRGNVQFFHTFEQAERHGYRACKRCKPREPVSNQIPDAVVRACKLMDDAEKPLSLGTLADAVGLSPFYFHRLFKKVVGVTPKAYASARRAERFRDGLREKETITQAMYGAGFGSSSRCYEGVGSDLGMTPTEYRSGGAGQSVSFAVTDCYLGYVIVAATERGVCLIEFGDKRNELRDKLAARFPKAELREDDPTFLELLAQVVACIEAPTHGLDVPLDIQGTAFQRRVWAALQDIPVGTTATYSEIARRIGKPTAVRAVASACAANKLAVAIPCHRAVRSDGELSGYRWGVERKRKLLDRETVATASTEQSRQDE
jgi:AraC family transcriptional regulator of adaptative response/methylated-DNA-[protein]-cysteine methyltransferase